MATHTWNLCSAFNPCTHTAVSSEQTHTHTVNTHPEQWAAIYAAQPDIAECDVFLGQHLCWPWNNIVINQSDFKNQFIIFVKFRITISVWCLYISVIHLSVPIRDYSWVRLGLGVGIWLRLYFWIKMLFQGQQNMLTQEHV